MAKNFSTSSNPTNASNLSPADGSFLSLGLNSNWSTANNGTTSANGNGTIQYPHHQRQYLPSGSGPTGHIFDGSHFYPGQTSGYGFVYNRTTQFPSRTSGFGNTNLGLPRDDVHFQTQVASTSTQQLLSFPNNFDVVEVSVTTRFVAPASDLHHFFNGGSSSSVSHGHDQAYHGISPNVGHGHPFNPYQSNIPYDFYNPYPMSALQLPQTLAVMTATPSSSFHYNNNIPNLYPEFGYPASGNWRGDVQDPEPISYVPFMDGASSSAFTGMMAPQSNQQAGPSFTRMVPNPARVEHNDEYAWIDGVLRNNGDGAGNPEGEPQPQAPPVEVEPAERVQLAVDAPQIVDDHDRVVGADGRTHSLPRKKGEPYKCPRGECGGVFPTSQYFAAHSSSHYKYETPEQRTRRLKARKGEGVEGMDVIPDDGPKDEGAGGEVSG